MFQNVLENLPGVDPNSEAVQQVIKINSQKTKFSMWGYFMDNARKFVVLIIVLYQLQAMGAMMKKEDEDKKKKKDEEKK